MTTFGEVSGLTTLLALLLKSCPVVRGVLLMLHQQIIIYSACSWSLRL